MSLIGPLIITPYEWERVINMSNKMEWNHNYVLLSWNWSFFKFVVEASHRLPGTCDWGRGLPPTSCMFYQAICNLFIFYFQVVSFYRFIHNTKVCNLYTTSISVSMVHCRSTLWIMLKCSLTKMFQQILTILGALSQKVVRDPPIFLTYLDSMQPFLSRKVSLVNFPWLFICTFYKNVKKTILGWNFKLYLFYSSFRLIWFYRMRARECALILKSNDQKPPIQINSEVGGHLPKTIYTVQGYFYQISKGGGAFEILDLF